MAFGKRKSNDDLDEVTEAATPPADDGEPDGPFDIEDFDDPSQAALARLDLGSVLIPMPEAGQVQVELTETGVPSAVWVVTPNGRFTIAAYAAPKSAGLWREVATELADSLRKDSAAVNIEDGPWGREVVGRASGVVRFIGVDGYRWMIRCVVNGAAETIDALSRGGPKRVGRHGRSSGRHAAAGAYAAGGAAARADGRSTARRRGTGRRGGRPAGRGTDSRRSRSHAEVPRVRRCSSSAPSRVGSQPC